MSLLADSEAGPSQGTIKPSYSPSNDEHVVESPHCEHRDPKEADIESEVHVKSSNLVRIYTVLPEVAVASLCKQLLYFDMHLSI